MPLNALWEPPWPTTDPALRKLQAGVMGDSSDLESELLAGIGGANLCCDVFGAHSKGEMASGLAFHGEAGLTTWEVDGWDAQAQVLTMSAHLRRTMLRYRRHFSLDGPTVKITEEISNLCSFERALGRTQHVTVGEQFLLDRASGDSVCAFRANCDVGHTWPTDHDEAGELSSRWAPATPFTYPSMPLRGGGTATWERFPHGSHGQKSSDLATMRVAPSAAHGWFVAERAPTAETGDVALALACAWERATFPWLMTWEEMRSRQTKPWEGRTVCRGLEVSSYAFATSRRDNVERGRLLDTPCFEWLDADETKVTTWYLSLQAIPEQARGGTRNGLELCGLA